MNERAAVESVFPTLLADEADQYHPKPSLLMAMGGFEFRGELWGSSWWLNHGPLIWAPTCFLGPDYGPLIWIVGFHGYIICTWSL